MLFSTEPKQSGLNMRWIPSQRFFGIFSERGHPVRAAVSEVGPLLLSRLLDLNDTQEGVLNIAFRVANENNLLLLDLKDLRAVLEFVAERASELTSQYGNVSKSSVGAIQRQLLVLENQGAEHFFGEPALKLADLLRTDRSDRGYVNILASDKLMQHPKLYSTFLLWLLSELFEELPEVGDVDKPKLVFFFDEAHLLFNDAPKALVEKIEQVVRLIRSKGVGVFFVTQNPLDVPDRVLAQLGNKVQHALRAFSPRDQRAVKAAADTFRTNPNLDTATIITELGKGEALVSFLEDKGTPSVVERCLIRPPASRLGIISDEERGAIIKASPVKGVYDEAIDPESAHEILSARVEETAADASEVAESEPQSGGGLGGIFGGLFGTARKRGERLTTTQRVSRSVTRSVTNRVVGKMAADIGTSILGKQIGSTVGRAIVRGVLGSILRR